MIKTKAQTNKQTNYPDQTLRILLMYYIQNKILYGDISDWCNVWAKVEGLGWNAHS